jgi:hypothetical protein
MSTQKEKRICKKKFSISTMPRDLPRDLKGTNTGLE